MIKRIISLILTLSMMLSLGGMAAVADSLYDAGSNAHWETHVQENVEPTFDVSKYSHLSGVEIFWKYIATLDDETAQGILRD